MREVEIFLLTGKSQSDSFMETEKVMSKWCSVKDKLREDQTFVAPSADRVCLTIQISTFAKHVGPILLQLQEENCNKLSLKQETIYLLILIYSAEKESEMNHIL